MGRASVHVKHLQIPACHILDVTDALDDVDHIHDVILCRMLVDVIHIAAGGGALIVVVSIVASIGGAISIVLLENPAKLLIPDWQKSEEDFEKMSVPNSAD